MNWSLLSELGQVASFCLYDLSILTWGSSGFSVKEGLGPVATCSHGMLPAVRGVQAEMQQKHRWQSQLLPQAQA